MPQAVPGTPSKWEPKEVGGSASEKCSLALQLPNKSMDGN